MDPASEMLREEPLARGAALVIGGNGDLIRALGDGAADATLTWIATDVRETIALPPTVDLRTDLADPLAEDERFTTVLLPAPPDRSLVRRWLALAAQHVVPGGTVRVAGANAEGIKSAIGDAATLFGKPVAEDYRRKQRIGRFVMPESTNDVAWRHEPGIAPGSWRHVELAGGLRLATLPGVFAAARLDTGTQLLLDNLEIAPGESVLDVGCGMGAIGVTALVRGAGAVDLTDVNLLAIASCRRTIADLELTGIRALAGDVYDAVGDRRYDLIVSNPPFHQGKAIDYAMPERLIDEAPAHLADRGRLVIVANAFLAYGKRMEERFREVEVVAATRQYHVLAARRPR